MDWLAASAAAMALDGAENSSAPSTRIIDQTIAATTQASTAAFAVLAISADAPPPDAKICKTAFMPPYSAALLTMKTRNRRRPSTRSDDHEAMVCPTASAMKPSASRLAATMAARADTCHMQLTRLKAVTAAQTSACHHRSSNASSNSARVNSQNTTILPVDSASNGTCQFDTGDGPIAEVTAWATDPSAKAAASRPATTFPKSRNNDAASSINSATVAARNAISGAESSISSSRRGSARWFRSNHQP